ncbi:aldehyde dehydrogenase family protein [Halomonas sp. MCCC 1A11036]|uniref:Aldehyde dehydrogenase family protein n=1 Tax=Billgrantia zhangzhouensis TaxID=2733481 RepID=A0ABS9AFH9_9GAMM|nr:aldehyde dehydrogenase family protein [Halomonas zhangzhouensis]
MTTDPLPRRWHDAPGASFIDNQWVASASERRLPVINPYTEALITEVTAGHPRDVDAAVDAAQRALPAWQGLSGAERGKCLERFAKVLARRRDELARFSAANNGKVLAEAYLDLDDAIACYRYYARQALVLDERLGERIRLDMEGIEACCYHDPVGVVGLITPWNLAHSA